KARDSGRETDAPYGRRLLKEVIERLASALQAYAERPRRRGKPPVADRYFQVFSSKKNPTAQDGAEALAFILGKLVIDRMSEPRRFTTVAIGVGEAIEKEARKGQSNHPRARRVDNVHVADRSATQEHLHIGAQFLDIFIQTTGLVECVLERQGKTHSEQM